MAMAEGMGSLNFEFWIAVVSCQLGRKLPIRVVTILLALAALQERPLGGE
jgi:hypothetical protein